MASVQSPPGFINIFELIFVEGKGLAKLDVSKVDNSEIEEEKRDEFSLYKISDITSTWPLEYASQKQDYPVQINLLNIKIATNNSEKYQLLKINPTSKEYPDEHSIMQDTLTFIVMHRCRSLLSGKHLKAYILSDYTYRELPAEFWSYDMHWYRLLVNGAAYGDIESMGGKFHGSVYFKEEEVKRCSAIDPVKPPPSSSSLINLDIYTTPWLQVQAAIYDEYGKDGLAQSSKDSVVLFIKGYIKKHELDFSKSEVRFLATFMRLAEQKAGKKYHAELKLKKLNNQQGKK